MNNIDFLKQSRGIAGQDSNQCEGLHLWDIGWIVEMEGLGVLEVRTHWDWMGRVSEVSVRGF